MTRLTNIRSYLIATPMPIFCDGARRLVSADWHLDLSRTRDYLAKDLGGVRLIAPARPIHVARGDVVEIRADSGIDAVPVHVDDDDLRPRRYWRSASRTRWRAAVQSGLADAAVLHLASMMSVVDLYFDALKASIDYSGDAVPIMYFGPDEVPHLPARSSIGSSRQWAVQLASSLATDAHIRHSVARATVVMLKEGPIFHRYQRFRKDKSTLFSWCHAAYRRADVIPEEELDRRLSQRSDVLRLVYAGRLIPWKGVDRAIEIVAFARGRGVGVTLDVIGGGPDHQRLQNLAASQGIADHVRFVGPMPYGQEFLKKLRTYDALLYVPRSEDSPRMLFDAYAAGLPFLGHSNGFLQHRASVDEAGVVNDASDQIGWVSLFASIRPSELRELSEHARAAALRLSAEEMYRRFAEQMRGAIA